jgi:hypothetical protein
LFTGSAIMLAGVNASAPVPRLAYKREEAAQALGMSLDSFERHVQPEIRLVRRGALRLVPHSELEKWVRANASDVFA